MRKRMIAAMVGAALLLPGPVAAQDLGKAISGIAEALLRQEMERNAYAEAQRVNTVEGWRKFVAQFPNGTYRPQADAALSRLQAATQPPVSPVRPVQPAPAVSTPQAKEAALQLTRAERAAIQTNLTRLGFPTGGADGLWGNNTRAAIYKWQTANRLVATGYVTAAQITLIARQADRLAPLPPKPPEPVITPEQAERALDLSAPERREIQLRLTLLGYSTQGSNGNMGPLTRKAIQDWQRAQRLAETGFLTREQIAMLTRQTGG